MEPIDVSRWRTHTVEHDRSKVNAYEASVLGRLHVCRLAAVGRLTAGVSGEAAFGRDWSAGGLPLFCFEQAKNSNFRHASLD